MKAMTVRQILAMQLGIAQRRGDIEAAETLRQQLEKAKTGPLERKYPVSQDALVRRVRRYLWRTECVQLVKNRRRTYDASDLGEYIGFDNGYPVNPCFEDFDELENYAREHDIISPYEFVGTKQEKEVIH